MDNFILGEDINVMAIKADRFPETITTTFDKLYNTVSRNDKRRYFGISRPNSDGVIQYWAAAEEIDLDEAKLLGLERLTIKGGSYNTYYIKDYRDKTDAISECFQLLLGQDEVDPNGYCVEWYIGQDDVKCMVRCMDSDYPVDNDSSHPS